MTLEHPHAVHTVTMTKAEWQEVATVLAYAQVLPRRRQRALMTRIFLDTGVDPEPDVGRLIALQDEDEDGDGAQ